MIPVIYFMFYNFIYCGKMAMDFNGPDLIIFFKGDVNE